MASLYIIERLLSSNKQWVIDMNASHPDLFPRNAQGQSPEVLWIGCSDSRVPESVITASLPGEIFTHRNIANQFPVNDDSAGAVLEFSVGNLPIEHIIVAGHTRCGGALTALRTSRGRPPPTTPSLRRWLAPLTQRVINMNIDPGLPEDEAVKLVIDENIKMQVENISNNEVILKAKSPNREIYIHSWLYHIENGIIQILRSPVKIEDITN